MVVSVEKHALVAARVVDHAATKFRTVRTVHDQSAYRIRSIIDTKGGTHRVLEYLRQRAVVKRQVSRKLHIASPENLETDSVLCQYLGSDFFGAAHNHGALSFGNKK
jgi:hypothetical protein